MEELSGKCAECERVETQRSENMNLCRCFHERENSLRWEISRLEQKISQLEAENAKLLKNV